MYISFKQNAKAAKAEVRRALEEESEAQREAEAEPAREAISLDALRQSRQCAKGKDSSQDDEDASEDEEDFDEEGSEEEEESEGEEALRRTIP